MPRSRTSISTTATMGRETFRNPHSDSRRATGKLGMTDFIIQRFPVQDMIDQEESLDSIKFDIHRLFVKLTTVSVARTNLT